MEIWLEAERELVDRGAIPPAPPSLPKGPRAPGAADEIDEFKISRRLDDFGERPARSVTALG